MQKALWQTYLRVVVAATLTTLAPSLAPAQLSSTTTVSTCGPNGSNQFPTRYVYSNWKYKDSSGVTHDFPGTSERDVRASWTCGDGGHTCYCGVNKVIPLDTLSTDSSYYLNSPPTPATATATTGNIFYPAYQVVSIIYSAPGNKGQNGFTDTTADGTVTTVGSTFSFGEQITFSGGIFASVSFGFGTSFTSSNSSAFQEIFSDATGAAIVNQSSNPDAVNHDLDYFLIWLNPQVNVVGVPPNAYGYSVGIAPTANGDTPDPDIIGQNAVTMEANSAGMTTIEPAWLNPRTDPATGQSVPGLASICKNLNLTEYNLGECTLTDQCGCTPADFAPILKMDPLLYSNGTSNPLSPYPGSTNPLAANVSSQATCSTIPTPAGSNCRYVPVPESPKSTIQETLTLAGPDCSWCGNPVYPFQQADNQQTTNTQGSTTEEDVFFSVKGDAIFFSVTGTDTWKWTQSQSTGLISGNGYTAAVTLLSNTTGCGQTIPVFEDTVYHTFLFMQPGSSDPSQAASCTTATATPTFSPAAGTYISAQTVTISTPDGAYIYYTTNGSTPTTSSTLCNSTAGTCTITVSASETVKAISVIPGWNVSSVGSAAYIIE